jgi:MFS family permease
MGVRKRLSQLITAVGMVLGLAAAAGFVALIGPDVDWYGNKALRAVGGMLITSVLIGLGASWPFLWLADRIFVERPEQQIRSPSDSISFAKNESESGKSARSNI